MFIFINSAFAQGGAKFSTVGNPLSPGDFLGSTTNTPLDIKVNNALAVTIRTSGDLQLHKFSGFGSGLVLYDNSGILSPLAFSGNPAYVLLGNGQWGVLPLPADFWKLDSITNDLYTMTSGNIGIGTDHPAYKLDIFGNVRITENLYVGGGIIITDKVRASGDIKSSALKSDSIIMDSTRAFYGYSKFIDDVKMGNKLDVTGNTSLSGDLTTTGNIKFNSFSGNGNGLIAYDNLGALKSLPLSNSSSQVLLGDGSWGSIPIPVNYWQMNGDDIYTLTSGNIGIGTSTPQVKLDIVGDVRISSNLYVGGGIVISDKVNATTEIITKDLKSMSLKADSIIMDSTKAFYGESRFADDVKLDNKLKVNGDVQFNGNFTTSGNINFAGNQTLGYQPPSGGNSGILFIGTTPPMQTINLCYPLPSLTPFHYSGLYQSSGFNNVGDYNTMSMGYNGTNFMIDIATTGIFSTSDPGLLINHFCSKNVSICTGTGGNVQLTSTGKVGIGVLPSALSNAKLEVVGNVKISSLAPLNGTNIVQVGTDGILDKLTPGTALQVLLGTGVWGDVPNSTNNWSTTGNLGTSETTNFIGTTDATALVFNTGGSTPSFERMRILANGNVGIGTSTPEPNSKVHIVVENPPSTQYRNGLFIDAPILSNKGSVSAFSATGGASGTGNASTVKGTYSAKIGYVSAWDAAGNIIGGVLGYVKPQHINGSHARAFATGTSCIADLDNLVMYVGTDPLAEAWVGGMYAELKGTINIFPSIGTRNAVSAVIGIDNIKSSDGTGNFTYAGYFDGRGYFSGNVGIGTTTPIQKLEVWGAIKVAAAATTPFPADGTIEYSNGNFFGYAVGVKKSLVSHWSESPTNPNNIFYNSGNVTIGTPASGGSAGKLQVVEIIQNKPAIVAGDTTARSIWLVPYLGGWGYNPISKEGDIGIIFRNGNQNLNNAGLVIAPHSNPNDGAKGIRIDPNGSVGIGTADPQEKLHVENGKIVVTGTNSLNPKITIDPVGYSCLGGNREAIITNTPICAFLTNAANLTYSQLIAGRLYVYNNDMSKQLLLTYGSISAYNNSNQVYYITDIGDAQFHDLKIGDMNTGYTARITTEGKIWAQEMVVQVTDPFPDFVFEKDYQKMSLKELENYINQNKHLPGMPTADEITCSGINLGQMDAKLLQKIEELTLYVIELEKEIQTLKNK